MTTQRDNAARPLAEPPARATRPRATGSRGLDLVVAASLVLLLAPVLLVRALVARWQAGQVFTGETLIGRAGRPFRRLRFAGPAPGVGLAVLFNLLRGDLALAGPRPRAPGEPSDGIVGGEQIGSEAPTPTGPMQLRPGLFSPYGVQARTGIAHRPEALMDQDYVQHRSLGGDVALVLRGLIAALLGHRGALPMPAQLDLFGVPIANTTMAAALDWIDARAAQGPPALVAFVNPDCLNIAWGDAAYHRILNQADLVLPDGIGIHLGCRLLGVGLRANVNGTDLFPLLCERAAANGHGLFLLGARPGVAAAVAERMCARQPGLRILGTQDGYFDADETADVIARINASGAAILLVAFGVPRQEQWLARHHAALTPAVRLGVGGLFDFYSGRIPRAPVWMREIGLEWVWRLRQEPGRLWRRYLIGNPLFLYRVWRQARRRGHDPSPHA